MIRVSKELVDRSIGELRRCGRGRRECVVYWTASLSSPTTVADVFHPAHRSSWAGYAVDDWWLTRFSVELADCRRTAVAQIHTHPGDWVAHSATDDGYVLVPSPGFISIVIPRFAANVDFDGWGVYVLSAVGTWRSAPEEVRIE